MTVDDVRWQVAEIDRVAKSGDDETAHSMEDDLYGRVLRAIADIRNHHNSVTLCREALKSKELQFPRHCS